MFQTQLNAYAAIISTGKANSQREQILRFLQRVGDSLTLNEISEYTLIRLSSVSARVNELVAMKELIAAGKRKDRLTNRTNTVWTACGI